MYGYSIIQVFFFTLTIEVKMSFKVKTSKMSSNIHTTKSYQTKKKTLQTQFSTVQASIEHVLWKGKGWGGVALFKQQHQKNVTEKKIEWPKVTFFTKYKTVSNLPIPILYIATEHCCNTELCQHFSIARVSAFYNSESINI